MPLETRRAYDLRSGSTIVIWPEPAPPDARPIEAIMAPDNARYANLRRFHIAGAWRRWGWRRRRSHGDAGAGAALPRETLMIVIWLVEDQILVRQRCVRQRVYGEVPRVVLLTEAGERRHE